MQELSTHPKRRMSQNPPLTRAILTVISSPEENLFIVNDLKRSTDFSSQPPLGTEPKPGEEVPIKETCLSEALQRRVAV